jgi:hypothetical protein
VTDVQKELTNGPGGQGVAGSNPVSPTVTSQVRASIRRIGLRPLICLGANWGPLWCRRHGARELPHSRTNDVTCAFCTAALTPIDRRSSAAALSAAPAS